jgi:hypothetical protein
MYDKHHLMTIQHCYHNNEITIVYDYAKAFLSLHFIYQHCVSQQ